MTGSQGMRWLARRETLRVTKIWTQTVLAPVVSSLLFILVFGLSLSGRVRNVSGVPYDQFIVPGLIAMAMVQAAFANNSSTVFQARFDRYINDILSSPMHPWQMTAGLRGRRHLPRLPDRRLAAGAGGAADRRAASPTRSPWPPWSLPVPGAVRRLRHRGRRLRPELGQLVASSPTW